MLFLELFTCIVMENMPLLCMAFFLFELTCMASKRNSLTSMAFRPFLPFDGVKSRVK